ncbi:TraB/GumN family protein [uncultured Roseovarius sp.]|uniref:TraB/GumN family protein n=1 Tax=uncultured Roseovarius sp. TaxID=293344 RepID=UPI002623E37F|nr:TraB/GumN family protein [uncultured Roseovarius sp.]
MSRFLTVLLCLLTPLAAHARCDGTDLIAALPATEQQALSDRANATAYPNGLLWQAVRDDTTITLFGTYHFEHARTSAHLAALTPLIDQADSVYLEVSNADQTQLQRELADDPSIMFITEGDTLPDLLGEEDWQRLSAEMQARAIPGFMAAKFKPFWAAMMLGIGPCEARNAATKENGIDKQIGDYASSIGNDSRSLEDFRTLLTLFDSFPLEEQLDMIRLLFASSGDADDLAYTLRQRYLAQEVALIWEFSRLVSLKFGGATAEADFALFEEQLLIKRNREWIDLLIRDAPGKNLFLAVGAAHLPGDYGVLRLLEEQGFTIKRLPFDAL